MVTFSIAPHQEVNAALRDRSRSRQYQQAKSVPHADKESKQNLEWFLTQQQNTRQVLSRSGLRTQNGTRNLLMSSQALKRSQQHGAMSRQMTGSGTRTIFLSQENMAMKSAVGGSPKEFGFLTQKKYKRVGSSTKARGRGALLSSKNQKTELSQSQVCRKLHSDLQEYAIELLEERIETKVATKMKLHISSIQQSQQFQTLAIKFWIIIVNLQYYDVKRLSHSLAERQLFSNQFNSEQLLSEVDVQHTNLPIDLVIYERIVPLFLTALGCLADPHFKATQIPQKQEQQNKMIKRKQQQMLLIGQVHFDKFVVDLLLMLGANVLNLQSSDVTFIYRKCYLVMTHRFPDEMHFVQATQIQSPFQIDAILQAQRSFGVTPAAPVIIPSSINSDADKKSDNRGMQIMQTNEQLQQPQKQQSDAAHLSSQDFSRNVQPRQSFNLLRSQNSSFNQDSSRDRRQKSFTNLSVGQGIKLSSTGPPADQQGILPPPPHHETDNNQPLMLSRLDTNPVMPSSHKRKNSQLFRRRTQLIPEMGTGTNDSRSSASGASKRQQIRLGLPKEKALDNDPTNAMKNDQLSSQADTDRDMGQDACVQILDDFSHKESGISIKHSIEVKPPMPVAIGSNGQKKELFNFDQLHSGRQAFKNELAEKIAFSRQRIQSLVPFETVFTKKSCLDYIAQAKEFLVDEEIRVSKTPAGFTRPANADTKQIVLQKRKIQYPPGQQHQSNTEPFNRQGTMRLDQENGLNNPNVIPVAQLEKRQLQNQSQNNENNQSFSKQIQKNVRPQMLNRQYTGMSLESGESSAVSSQRPPVVRVTQYGTAIDSTDICDSGFLRYKLEEEAENVFQSSNSGSGIAQDPSFHRDNQRHNFMMQQLKSTSPQYMVQASLSKLNNMTHRLLQENLMDRVIKSRLLERAKAKNGDQEDDLKHLQQIFKKIDQDLLMKQQNNTSQQSVEPASPGPYHDVSFIQEQRSFEEQVPTNHTTSQEDSNYLTQEPMTHPKFNQDLPLDVFEKNINSVTSQELSCIKEQPLTEMKQNATSIGKDHQKQTPFKPTQQQQQKHEQSTTMQLQQTTSSGHPISNKLNKRLFGNSAAKGLSPIYTRLGHQQFNMVESPFMVQSVDKNDIDEMEGKDTSQIVRMVNAKSGRDANKSLIETKEEPVAAVREKLRIVPLSTNQSSHHEMHFDNNRKSYVTAMLSGQGPPEMESDEDNQIQQDGDYSPLELRSFASLKRGLAAHKSSSKIGSSDDPTAKSNQNGDYAEQAQSQKQLLQSRSAAGSSIALKSQKARNMLNKSSAYASSDSQNRIKRLSQRQASVAVGKSYRDLDIGEHVVNINVNQESAKNSKVFQFEDIDQKQRKSMSREDKLRSMVKKQKKVFPFGSGLSQLVKNKNVIMVTQSPTNEERGTDSNKKLQAGLFALRRANKNRRSQLHRATESRKTQIVNSSIPGVDYSRQVTAADLSQNEDDQIVWDQNDKGLKPLSPLGLIKNGTLLIPEEVFKSMNQNGFLIFDSHNNLDEKTLNKRKSNVDISLQKMPSATSSQMQRNGTLVGQEVISVRSPDRATNEPNPISDQSVSNDYNIMRPNLNSAGGQTTFTDEAFTPQHRLISKNLSTNISGPKNSLFAMHKEIAMSGEKKQNSENPLFDPSSPQYKMIIQQPVKRQSNDCSTQLLDQMSISPNFKHPTSGLNPASTTHLMKLNLEKVLDTEGTEKDDQSQKTKPNLGMGMTVAYRNSSKNMTYNRVDLQNIDQTSDKELIVEDSADRSCQSPFSPDKILESKAKNMIINEINNE